MVPRFAKSWTQLRQLSIHTRIHTSCIPGIEDIMLIKAKAGMKPTIWWKMETNIEPSP